MPIIPLIGNLGWISVMKSKKFSALFFMLGGCLTLALLLLGQGILKAQSAAPPAPPPPSAPSSDSSSRGSSGGGGIAVDSSYVLQKNDDIRITVFGEDDMTTETRISKTGNIAFPLLGSLKIDGMTIDEATAQIRRLLDKDYIVNPQVRIMLMDYAKQRITILGQVKNPGEMELPVEGGLDLLGAVAMAGGFTRIADPGRVTVRRNMDGKDVVLKVNAKDLERNDNVKPFLVQPGDTITVPESIF
jgi:polysaccharide export outer membrane protein